MQTNSNGYNSNARAHNAITDNQFQGSEKCATNENIAEENIQITKKKSGFFSTKQNI